MLSQEPKKGCYKLWKFCSIDLFQHCKIYRVISVENLVLSLNIINTPPPTCILTSPCSQNSQNFQRIWSPDWLWVLHCLTYNLHSHFSFSLPSPQPPPFFILVLGSFLSLLRSPMVVRPQKARPTQREVEFSGRKTRMTFSGCRPFPVSLFQCIAAGYNQSYKRWSFAKKLFCGRRRFPV